MEGSSRCGSSMDIFQSYLEEDPNLLTDLQLSSSSDSSSSEEEEEPGIDEVGIQNDFAKVSQHLLDELEKLEEEFQNKAVLLEEERVQASNALEQLSQEPVPTSNHLPEDKPLNHHPEDWQLSHLSKDEQINCPLEDRPLNHLSEDRPLNHTREGRLLSDIQEERPPQPEQGHGTIEKEEDLQPKAQDLEEMVRTLLEEKKQNTEDIGQLKCQIQKLKEELKDEQLERKSLAIKLQKSQRKFLKLNRVSLVVTQEYADIMGQLELEQDLRLEAENIAHRMLREKRAVSRQSMILMQNLEPDEMLIKALEDVRTLTTTLEETKAELQAQVKSLELQLAERPSQEEFAVIKEELNTTKMENHQLEEKLKGEQENCVDLYEKVKKLEEKLKEMESLTNAKENLEMIAEPIPPPPPPPPPPPMCQLSTAPKDPLALVRERRGLRPPAAEIATVSPDVREKAILEMKQRIERGDILRPTPKAGQKESAMNKRKSAICELQGVLLSAARKPLRRVNRPRISRKVKDSELSSLLQKRRQIVDCSIPADKSADTPKPAQDCTAGTERQSHDKGGSQAPEAASSFQNNPFFRKMEQRPSPIQSRRSSQVQWQ